KSPARVSGLEKTPPIASPRGPEPDTFSRSSGEIERRSTGRRSALLVTGGVVAAVGAVALWLAVAPARHPHGTKIVPAQIETPPPKIETPPPKIEKIEPKIEAKIEPSPVAAPQKAKRPPRKHTTHPVEEIKDPFAN